MGQATTERWQSVMLDLQDPSALNSVSLREAKTRSTSAVGNGLHSSWQAVSYQSWWWLNSVDSSSRGQTRTKAPCVIRSETKWLKDRTGWKDLGKVWSVCKCWSNRREFQMRSRTLDIWSRLSPNSTVYCWDPKFNPWKWPKSVGSGIEMMMQKQ